MMSTSQASRGKPDDSSRIRRYTFCLILGMTMVPPIAGIWFPYSAIFAPLIITVLVWRAMVADEISDSGIILPQFYALDPDSRQTLTAAYDKTIQMHVETDKGMYQIVGIFVPASLLFSFSAGRRPIIFH